MRIFKNLSLAVLALLFFDCSSTQTTATWSKPQHQPSNFQRVAVLGIMGSLSARQSFENEIVEQLQKQDVPAVAAMQLLPPNNSNKKNISVDQMIRRLHQNGVDAVIVVSLSDVNRKKQYVPGTTYVRPRTYYHRFGDYYVHTYRRVHTPGYVRRSTTYFLESTLYDLHNQEMIWTSEAKSTDPNSLRNASKSYAKSIVKSLDKDDII